MLPLLLIQTCLVTVPKYRSEQVVLGYILTMCDTKQGHTSLFYHQASYNQLCNPKSTTQNNLVVCLCLPPNYKKIVEPYAAHAVLQSCTAVNDLAIFVLRMCNSIVSLVCSKYSRQHW